MSRGVHRLQAAAELAVELVEAAIVAVEHGHVCAHADRDLCRVGAGDTAADDNDFGGHDTRHAAQQDAAAALGAHQGPGGDLHRHAAGHLAHRAQQRQAALRIGDGLIGDSEAAGLFQAFGLHGIRREVEVGEERMLRREARGLFRLGLLHLHDQFGGFENGVCVRQDLAADPCVILVRKTGAEAGAILNDDLWPARTSSPTLSGVRPTRDSCFLISVGTPMRISAS
jgi:hypothetical protein